MRIRTIVGIVIVGAAITAAGVSVWILRQPLHQTYQAIRQESTNQGEQVRFAVVGDNHGDNPIYRQILNELQRRPVDFLLNLGDTSEYGRREEFTAIKGLESSLPFPVYHTVGNHDIKTDDTRQVFTDVFDQAPCAAYDHGELHLIVLDNADRRVGFPSDCLAWLANDLQQHRDQTLVIAYHRPFDLPLGQVFGDDETAASRSTNLQFKEIVAEYPIKYIFTGHVHTYVPYAVADIPAVVSGGGGDPAQTALGGPKNNLFHYLLATVQNGSVSLEVHRVQLTTGS